MRRCVRTRGLAAAALLLAVSAAQGQTMPERITPTGFPMTPSAQVKPTLLEAATANGDLDRMVARVRAYRGIVDAVVQQANPEALPKLAPSLDEYFSVEKVRERVVARFGIGINEYHPAEILAWAKAPDMAAINAAVRDFDFSRDGDPVSPDREALLKRLAMAMVLPDFAASQTRDAQELAAMTMDAIDPAAGAMASLQSRGSGVSAPPLDVLLQKWLAPALEKQSDAAIAKFLAFAEGEAGRSYFSSFFVSGTVRASPVFAGLPALVAANAASAPEADADPQALADEAEHLIFEVGTHPAYDDARRLLLRADRAAPRDARIKTLLGHVTLATRPGPRARPGELRHPEPIRSLFKPAEDYWRSALDIDPDYPEALYGLGLSAFAQHDDATAKDYFDRVANLQPDHPRLMSVRADLALAQGRLDDAIAGYLAVLAAPEKRVYVHHAALENVRIAYAQSGRLEEFTRLGYAHLAKSPDSRDFRFVFAEHLLDTGEPASKVLAVVDPVPDRWLPSRKIGIRLRALAREAGDAPTAAQRAGLLEEARKLPGGIDEAIQRSCGRPDGVALATMLAESSKEAAHATAALGCAVLGHHPQFVERLVGAGADIDAQTSMMQETPLGIAFFMGNAEMFELLLEHGADPLRATRDGRTFAELLESRAGQAADTMRAALAKAAKKGTP